jgi:hypothetical protein
MGLRDPRMDGTCANMIIKGIKRKPFADTCPGRQRANDRNLRARSKGEECLTETV